MSDVSVSLSDFVVTEQSDFVFVVAPSAVVRSALGFPRGPREHFDQLLRAAFSVAVAVPFFERHGGMRGWREPVAVLGDSGSPDERLSLELYSVPVRDLVGELARAAGSDRARVVAGLLVDAVRIFASRRPGSF